MLKCGKSSSRQNVESTIVDPVTDVQLIEDKELATCVCNQKFTVDLYCIRYVWQQYPNMDAKPHKRQPMNDML